MEKKELKKKSTKKEKRARSRDGRKRYTCRSNINKIKQIRLLIQKGKSLFFPKSYLQISEI